MPVNTKDLVFLSYAREDVENVRVIYKKLTERGLNLWFDEVSLQPGPWKPQIQKAIASSRYFLLCLSKAALRKIGSSPGFQDEELNEAYNISLTNSLSTFTIIPLRLENCERGDLRSATFQQYDLFPASLIDNKLDKIAVAIGGFSLSEPNLQNKLSDDERLVESLLARCETFIYANDISKAEELVDVILKQNPKNPEAYHLKACILESDNKLDQAIENYSHAIDLFPNYAKAFNNRGLAYQKLKKNEEAINDYCESIRLNPNEAIAYFNRGYAYGEQGKIDDMIENFTIAIKLNQDFAPAYKNRGVYYLKNGNIEKSLKDLKEAHRINPKDPEILRYRGEANYLLDNFSAALEDYNIAINLAKEYREAYFKRALVREDIGDLNGAIEDYTKVICLQPTAIAYINRALVFKKMGDTEKASADCDEALKLDPNDPEANNLLEVLKTREILNELLKGSAIEPKIRWK